MTFPSWEAAAYQQQKLQTDGDHNPMALTRRSFLTSSVALGVAGCLLPSRTLAADKHQLTIGNRSIDVLGRSAKVFGLTDEEGRPGLLLRAGEPFSVALENTLNGPTSIHWHGQTPAPELDGISETGYVAPLAAGETRSFYFEARPGTHWMHSHHELQEQALLTAPLIVQSPEDAAIDSQDVTLLLNDFSFRDPLEIFQGLTGSETMDHGAMSGMANMEHSMESMGGADLNDVTYDAFLANDRTLDDPQVVRTERNGRVRLRIINGAASTAFWIDVGAASATLIAADGNRVEPVQASRFPLAQAQRIDLLLDVPAGAAIPVFARREGDTARTGIILAAPGATIERYAGMADSAEVPVDLSIEGRLIATAPLASRPADIRHTVMLTGAMAPYSWTLDERVWAKRRKLEVAEGQRVEIEFMNHSMMAHPMHLHGHHFQVTEIEGRKFSGAMRDTVLVPAMGTVVVAFDADNPGRWLYHCHNLYHMMAGMMSEVVYT
ncbi:multicopper oxidase family protein [Devosia sp.]|uniref:multicopper oxidase family protein n=1 Tax=Devosia sp. TaxID=1871048 RepID=UPI003F6EC1F2